MLGPNYVFLLCSSQILLSTVFSISADPSPPADPYVPSPDEADPSPPADPYVPPGRAGAPEESRFLTSASPALPSPAVPGPALRDWEALGNSAWENFVHGGYYWSFVEEDGSSKLPTPADGGADTPADGGADVTTFKPDVRSRVVLEKGTRGYGQPWYKKLFKQNLLRRDSEEVYLFSISKMLTSVGVMISMERRPKDWYPQKKIHEFAGWEFFKDFCVAGTNGECEFPAKKLYDVTIAQLLTHTSGIPFSKEGNPTEIQATPLWFAPSEGWGYSIGHRILGWVLRDYWRKDAGFQAWNEHALPLAEQHDDHTTGVERTLRFLYWDKLELHHTNFGARDSAARTVFLEMFNGEAGDAGMVSTAEDLMKFALFCLRRGKLVNGEALVSEENWNLWATTNFLPGGKTTEQLPGSSQAAERSYDLEVLQKLSAKTWWWDIRTGTNPIPGAIAGKYGYSYLGGTFETPTGNYFGWAGLARSQVLFSYDAKIAFVLAQNDIPDVRGMQLFSFNRFMDVVADVRKLFPN